jgi:CRP-like cAMP-binding protein
MVTIDLFNKEDNYDTFAAGQTIFREGDQPTLMYVVIKGEVMLSVKGIEVEKLGPGGVLGEMAMIDSVPRSATAVAQTNCSLVPVDHRRFIFLVQQTPKFAIQIMRVMADRLRRMDDRL